MKQGIYSKTKYVVTSLAVVMFALFAVVAIHSKISQAAVATDTTSTSTSTSPVISMINASSTSDGTGATITWTTDRLSTSQIAYGTSLPYGSYSALNNSGSSTSHSVMISSLMPNTMYHFQVISGDATGIMGTTTSPDQTFMTSVGTTTGTGTTTGRTGTLSLVTSSVSNPTYVQGGTTNISGTVESVGSSTANVAIKMNIINNTTLAELPTVLTGQTLLANTPMMFTIASPATLMPGSYHVVLSVWNSTQTQTLASYNVGSFTVTSSDTGTTTGTTTPPTGLSLQGLQDEITALQQQVASLQNQITNILNRGNGNGGGTTTPPVNGGGMISPSNATASAGSSIDFTGSHFGIEEPVVVMSNGSVITTAHADGGGNFSTGSMSVPTTLGTKMYTFTGSNSHITASATVTIQ